MMTTGNPPGEGFGQEQGGPPPGSDNMPGTTDAAADQASPYLQEPDSTPSAQDPSGPEDPRRREARLSRRRRLLKIGGVPAVLATIISLWLGSIFLISLSGNRAVAAGHYDTALSRYRLVARINPWLEQWRVDFNLGTDPTSAVTTLNRALSKAPAARTDPQTKAKQTGSPECMVRTNLYVAHISLAAKAQESGNSTSVTEHVEAAKKAADTCEVPPPPEQDPSQSPNPSATPSSDPSTTPSSDPSASASSSPGETSSGSPSAQSTPTPVDDRAKRLRDRNNGGSGATEKPGGGDSGGKPW